MARQQTESRVFMGSYDGFIDLAKKFGDRECLVDKRDGLRGTEAAGENRAKSRHQVIRTS